MYYGHLILIYVRIVLIASIIGFQANEIYAQGEPPLVEEPSFVKGLALVEGIALTFSFVAKEEPKAMGGLLILSSPFMAANAPTISFGIFMLVTILGLGAYNINAGRELEDAQTKEESDKIEDRILRNNFIAWNAIFIAIAIGGSNSTSEKRGGTINPIVIFDGERFTVAARYRF